MAANDTSAVQEIMREFDAIEYGHVDANGSIHRQSDADFDQAEFKKYRLQSFDEIRKNQVGVCWDQVEYARELFRQRGILAMTYAIVYYDHEHNNYFNHTILVFSANSKWYWFEHSLEYFRGIHEYDSLKQLFLAFKEEFLHSNSKIPPKYQKDRLCLWEYDELKPHSSPLEIFKQWESGRGLNEFLNDQRN